MKSRKWVLISLICQVISLCLFVIGIFSTEIKHGKEMHEYQLQIDFDTVSIYEQNRFVGSYVITDKLSQIDSILALDNQ